MEFTEKVKSHHSQQDANLSMRFNEYLTNLSDDSEQNLTFPSDYETRFPF